jgi:hypothetical protein
MEEELTPNVESTSATQNDTFMSDLQTKLAGATQIVSSSDAEIERGFTNAISQTERAGQASSRRIQSEFGRNLGYTRQEGERALGTMVESERGFATSRAAMIRLDSEIEREVKDLEQRKQEALLSNEAAVASRISDLQIQQLEFKSQMKQRYFDNLIQSSNFALSMQSMEQNQRQFQVTTAQQERRLSMDEYQFALSQPLPSFQELSNMSDEELSENFIAFRIGQRAGFTPEQIKQNMLAASQVQDMDEEQGNLQRQLLRAQIAETYQSMQGMDINDPPTMEGYYSYDIQLGVSARIRQIRDANPAMSKEAIYKSLASEFQENQVTRDALARTLGIVKPGQEDIAGVSGQARRSPRTAGGIPQLGVGNIASTLGAGATYVTSPANTLFNMAGITQGGNLSFAERKRLVESGAAQVGENVGRGAGAAVNTFLYPFKQ